MPAGAVFLWRPFGAEEADIPIPDLSTTAHPRLRTSKLEVPTRFNSCLGAIVTLIAGAVRLVAFAGEGISPA